MKMIMNKCCIKLSKNARYLKSQSMCEYNYHKWKIIVNFKLFSISLSQITPLCKLVKLDRESNLQFVVWVHNIAIFAVTLYK